jgi:electron transport complex protein RnfD
MSVTIEKSGPFGHAPSSVSKTMITVLVALLPATLFNVWLFGWPALFMFLITVGACLGFEAICLAWQNRPVKATLFDGSAALTGWLLAMSLPPWTPWWIGVLGALLAIVLAKHIYGGLGQNVFNPAMVGRVGLLVSFPVQMTAFVPPKPLFSEGAPGFIDSLGMVFGGFKNMDTISAASALGHVKTELTKGVPVTESLPQVFDLTSMITGMHIGSFGETSAILILLGGLFLMVRGVISWHTPVGLMGTLFVCASIANFFAPERFPGGVFHLFAGATFLGAFFIATDYVTSPVSKMGQLAYGMGCGFLIWIIRSFAGYPEGVAFAVLLMNALTPVIDHHIRPRAFGRTSKGEPLSVRGDSK